MVSLGGPVATRVSKTMPGSEEHLDIDVGRATELRRRPAPGATFGRGVTV